MNFDFIFQKDSLWFILIWVGISFILWLLYRKKYKERSSFDHSLIGVILTLLLHRLLHILAFSENYTESYWSINPYVWIQGEKVLFGSKPWILLSVFRGGFDFRLLILAAFVIFLLISKLQQMKTLKFLNDVLKNLFYIYPVVLFASFFRRYWIGIPTSFFLRIRYFSMEDLRIPVQLIELIGFICVTALSLFISKKLKFVRRNLGYIQAILVLLLEAFILKFLAYNIPSIVINWMLGMSLALFALMIISFLSRNFGKKDNLPSKKTVNPGRFTNFAFQ